LMENPGKKTFGSRERMETRVEEEGEKEWKLADRNGLGKCEVVRGKKGK